MKDHIILNKKPYAWFEQISGPRSGDDGDSCSKVGCNAPIPSQDDCSTLVITSRRIADNLANNGQITPERKQRQDEIWDHIWDLKKDRCDLNVANLEYDRINDNHSNCQDGSPAIRQREPQLLAQLVAQGKEVKRLEKSLIINYARLYYKIRTT